MTASYEGVFIVFISVGLRMSSLSQPLLPLTVARLSRWRSPPQLLPSAQTQTGPDEGEQERDRDGEKEWKRERCERDGWR